MSESSKVTNLVSCKYKKITPASDGWGALYSCIGGRAETVKLFINEEAGTGRVKNIKFMWNEWTKDAGYGKKADSGTAKEWVSKLAKTYARNKQDEVVSAFYSKANKAIIDGKYVLKYSYHVGPAIDERMIIITTKGQESAKSAARISEKSDYDACRSVISKAVKYPISELSGDGDPVKESGYKSFMIKGKGRDLFFCEVHRDNKYKISAALGGKYPFKYIAQGDLR